MFLLDTDVLAVMMDAGPVPLASRCLGFWE